ncbi:putative Peptidase_M75 [Vibrio nigripulchritudo SO65]|uniref:imelysin family protein n=1 Tax=Vibrio nigripulchritudo TaxID=28173 RepID=UPI0003B20840|nr:imelysin family protein [Vibrio nigripulchritudo]CCN33453.1 putative Peptidase_M75 [Vibrio nigripulchritudo AM115]CCN41464.1 putative Peptidase_M75 [Vibrio nigripulchritudo FTn2]CCN64141.1 putative Peptidase_M75 [Vibrio nigripulchritudo POn4]CCN75793.1 putative Peptidase_M75 [Vibrio nigripulchritudo SO65]
MKKTLSLCLLALVGCQSNDAQMPQEIAVQSGGELPEHKQYANLHISEAVYDVEKEAAFLLLAEAQQQALIWQQYCGSEDLTEDSLKSAWHSTMLRWMALQGQERGPENALKESWNMQFWPDKKNTTGRKMSTLVKADKAWSANDLSQMSVTVQGLGSMEWLLYDKASPIHKDKIKACDSGLAISLNIADKSDNIADAWQANPWKSLDEKKWRTEYLSLLSNQLEYSMKKMSRPLAKVGKPRPYFAESWRSETSLSNLKANVKAMKALYIAHGYGLDKELRDRGRIQLADSIVEQFDLTLDTWPEESSMFAMLKSKEGYRNVLAQFNKLEHLKYLIHEEVAIELGVVVGFNATDGD